MHSATLITSHLNAPFGAVLREQDLAESLRMGRLSGKTDLANAVLGYLFVETDPRLIATCAQDSGVSVAHAHQLYLDTLNHQAPRSPQWERAVARQL